jgi:hypothetical protein
MTLPSETVSLAGSGLVFVNTYTAAVTDAYRGAILAAENVFQSHFTDAVTVNMVFDLTPLTSSFVAQNEFRNSRVSYAAFAAALAAHATTADDILAVAGLPLADPTHGLGVTLPIAQAHMLGLSPAGGSLADDTVRLNSNLAWTFGQDAVSALEHEISEGVFGRVGAAGISGGGFSPMDLFRFTLAGVRDYTGGSDGLTAVFGIDATHLTSMVFHNSISPSGANDGFDLADWKSAVGDAFGLTNLAAPGVVTDIDLRVLDILGWKPASSGLSAAALAVQGELTTVLRWQDGSFGSDLLSQVNSGQLSQAAAIAQIVHEAANTTSVATIAYQFFTGSTPSAAGLDYLVSPAGPNANNLNSAYYQGFNIENRYINFAVNLGKLGAGAASFQAQYGSLSLTDATSQAYATLFGTTPTAAKVATLLDAMVPNGLGGQESRAQYFAFYGQDGATGIGTKAAMVGWLMAEAVQANLGDYALSNAAYLTDLANGTGGFAVNMIGHYDQPAFHYTGG